MKLTKSHKQAFVAAVMDDVPQHDYSEDFHKLIDVDMLKVAPPKLVPILQDKDLRSYLIRGYGSIQPSTVHKGNHYWYPYTVGISAVATYHDYAMSAEAETASIVLMNAAVEQKIKRDQLESMVRGTIESCSTLKQATERLPEFTKYLPEEASATRMLPAVANLSAKLIEAGWPKEAVAA